MTARASVNYDSTKLARIPFNSAATSPTSTLRSAKIRRDRSLDEKPINERLEIRKNQMIKINKDIEEKYRDLEGSKIFTKCLLSSFYLLEELVKDREIQYIFINLILSLSNNWRNFLELTKKNVLNLNEEISNNYKEMKSLQTTHEIEMNLWEETQRRKMAKIETNSLLQQYNALKEKHIQIKLTAERDKNEMLNKIFALTAANDKLTRKLKAIEESGSPVKIAQTIQKLTDDLYKTEVALQKEKERNSTTEFRLTNLLDAERKELEDKKLLINKLYQQCTNSRKEDDMGINKLNEYKAKVKQNEELMLMSIEDSLLTKRQIKNMKEKMEEYKEIIREGNKEIERLKTQIELQKEGLIQKDNISMEGTLFDFVWEDNKSKENAKIKSSSREEQIKSSTEERFTEEGEIKLTTISLKNYCYAKPTYRSLVSHLLSKNMKYEPLFPTWLYVVIRAIFDSKINEVLLAYNKGKEISRFPEFVFSWLGTFYIDKDSKTIKELSFSDKETMADKNRVNLLLGLKAISAEKLWEVNLFKEFLEENLSLDELVYFLHCRFILFKGPQLAVPGGDLCIKHFITKEKTGDIIDRIMYAYSIEERDVLKQKLINFCENTYKNGNSFDYAMVLRILIEFYRKEKKENFMRFENLYKISKKVSWSYTPIVPFDDFHKMIAGNYDKSISDMDLCRLYREAYIGGGCSISCDSVLLAFCETPFWLRYLRLKGQKMEPGYDDKGNISQVDERGRECAAVYE